MFKLVLAPYPIEQIRPAFGAYLRTSSDFPAPADIVAIIGQRPKRLDRDVYRALMAKEAMLRSESDWEYIRKYQQQAKEEI